jgi:hypothetical protein
MLRGPPSNDDPNSRTHTNPCFSPIIHVKPRLYTCQLFSPFYAPLKITRLLRGWLASTSIQNLLTPLSVFLQRLSYTVSNIFMLMRRHALSVDVILLRSFDFIFCVRKGREQPLPFAVSWWQRRGGSAL